MPRLRLWCHRSLPLKLHQRLNQQINRLKAENASLRGQMEHLATTSQSSDVDTLRQELARLQQQLVAERNTVRDLSDQKAAVEQVMRAMRDA